MEAKDKESGGELVAETRSKAAGVGGVRGMELPKFRQTFAPKSTKF